MDVANSSSESDDDSLSLLALLLERKRKRCTSLRRFRVHPLWKSRREKGLHNNLIMEMALVDEVMFRQYTRMTVGEYEQLLQEIGPALFSYPTREDTINPSTKLMATLRFLATGETISSLHVSFRMGKSTLQKCIFQTLDIIWNKLQPMFLSMPRTPEEWIELAEGFESQWQFPHCWGAMDGKHIIMQAQPHSGSMNFNYKKQHSINLLAVCDANYRFIIVDIGGRGRESDGGVLKRSNFGKKLFDQELNLPPPSQISPARPPLPYFCVADEAFPLHENIMRPFPGRSTGRMPNDQRIFNYRLSRARRVIENAFGILAAKWRIFRVPINAKEENIRIIVSAAACLHNYLRKVEDDYEEDERHYCPMNFVDRFENGVLIEGEWRRDVAMEAFAPFPPNRVQNFRGIQIRQNLMHFFLNEGSVPWQQDSVDEGVC